MLRTPLLLLLAPVLAAGCATPYQRMGFMGGYDDCRITEDTFEVKFAGNGFTRPEKVRKYVLRRASEVTLLHGFTHFLPLQQADESAYMTTYSSSGQAHAYGGYQTGHAYGSSTGYAATIRKPATFMRITCFKDLPVRPGRHHRCPEVPPIQLPQGLGRAGYRAIPQRSGPVGD